VAGISLGALCLPDFKAEAQEVSPPMTELPILFTNGTPVKVLYLNAEGTHRSWRPIDWRGMTGVPLDIFPPLARVRASELEGYNGDAPYPIAWVSQLPHITGSPAEWSTIVGWGDLSSIKEYNGQIRGKKDGIISTYCYAEQRSLYANKIWNILTALEGIAHWMKDNGPLLPGRDYSMLEMSGLIEGIEVGHIYRMGRTSMGGGVCSVASTLSKSVFIASARGYTEEVIRALHAPEYRYWAPSIEPGITIDNSDATVMYFEGHTNPFDPDNVDYRFRLKPDSPPLYLSPRAHLAFDSEPSWDDIRSTAEARIAFSITLQTFEPRGDEELALANLRQRYANFHHFREEIVVTR